MFDHYILSSLVEELRSEITNFRLQKIWSVDQNSFLLKFKSKAYLYINLSPQKSHGRMLESKMETQDLPQPFLLALRKTLEGAKLLEVDQVKEDRTICLTFQGRTVTYDQVIYRLYIEFMGRHSNALITNEDKTILYAYKATPYEANTDHLVRPGLTYKPLIPPKKSPEGSTELIDNALDYNGFYNKLIKLLPEEVLDKNLGQIHKWIYSSRDFNIFLDEDGNFKDFHQFSNKNLRSIGYTNLSKMLAAYYEKEESSNKHLIRYRKILNNRLGLVQEKITKLNEDLDQAKSRESYKLWGELILAYLHEIPVRSSEVSLNNYYDNSFITIKLNPNKNPVENSQIYYKKYEKLSRSQPEIEKQLDQALKEKFSLEQLIYELGQVESASELEEISQEMEKLRLIQKKKRTSLKTSKPRVFVFEGYRFEVGKNNRQNDEIRKKVKNKNFVWFHSKDLPGSHVLLHQEIDKASKSSLEFGAKLASYYSKAQGQEVTVDYTSLSKVHRPKGGAPGYVNYFDARQIYTGALAEEILPFEEK